MTEIHPTAIIDPGAQIADDVSIGPYTVVENDVIIAEGSRIGPHVLLGNGTRLGKNCTVFKGASLGTIPQDLKLRKEKTYLEVGGHTTIREFATLNRGTSHSLTTRVGSHCLLMAYTHVAHDCQLGNHVILSNAVNLAGHVLIEDYVGIGGMTPVHQFTHIGAYSFIGGGLRINKDVPPYILAMGDPLKFGGLNSIGLKRRGYSSDQLSVIKKVYNIIYRQAYTVKEAISEIRRQFMDSAEAEHIASFLENSERGIIRL